jgi:hypothetical protein
MEMTKFWNWGKGIFVFYGLFVLLLVAFLFFSLGQKYELVEDDYYDKSVDYQNQIDKIDRATRLDSNFRTELTGRIYKLSFPSDFESNSLSGEITFFRPSDATKDKKVKIPPMVGNSHSVNLSVLDAGLWIAKIDWKYRDSTFYYEEEIILR